MSVFVKYSAYMFNRQSGMTLLELLLVVTILSAVAFMTLSQVTDNTSQVRFEDTKNRLQLIKKAIIGNTSRTLNGQPEIRGFVADMGRLPNSLQELIRKDYCDDPQYINQTDCTTAGDTWNTQANYQFDATTELWAGWNGPYLIAAADADYPRYTDGWGNDDGTNNFGWNFIQIDIDPAVDSDGDGTATNDFDELNVVSLGSDGQIGSLYGGLYDVDFSIGNGSLISSGEYQFIVTNDAGIGGVSVNFGAPYSVGECSDSNFETYQNCIEYASACRAIGYSSNSKDSSGECTGVDESWNLQIGHGWSCSDLSYSSRTDCIIAGENWEWRLRTGYICNIGNKTDPLNCANAFGVWVAPTYACRDNTDVNRPDIVAAVYDEASCTSVAGQFWTPVIPGYFVNASSSNRICLRIAYKDDGGISEVISSGVNASHDINWNGLPKTVLFTLPNGTSLPMGEMAFRIYEHNGTSCTINEFPESQPYEVISALPGAVPSTLAWPIR